MSGAWSGLRTMAPLGIVIPTLNEARALPLLLQDLSRLGIHHHVLVADGGSSDETTNIARRMGATVVHSARGRARQMNAGAARLDTPWLLFLHADVRVPHSARAELRAWLETSRAEEFGAFRFSLEGHHWFWRFIEVGQRLRERLSGLVYGDQGLLVSERLFQAVGGFPELPLMEDVEMFARLRKAGRWKPIPAPLVTSPRRYREEGRWRGWLRNTVLMTLYLLGMSPRRLARFYPRGNRLPLSGPSSPRALGDEALRHRREDRALLVFAKEPVPGRVKTRLSREVGADEAARIYHYLARRVVDQVKGGAYQVVVCYDPPDAREQVRRWLGREGVHFEPQSSGDLGHRLASATEWAFSAFHRIAIIGTDAPEVDAELVNAAFQTLDETDVVLGPARDGGYYLIGLREPRPELFQEIPWSTNEVFEVTCGRARELGLSVSFLPVRSDIDTLEDWQRFETDAARRGPPRNARPASAEGNRGGS